MERSENSGPLKDQASPEMAYTNPQSSFRLKPSQYNKLFFFLFFFFFLFPKQAVRFSPLSFPLQRNFPEKVTEILKCIKTPAESETIEALLSHTKNKIKKKKSLLSIELEFGTRRIETLCLPLYFFFFWVMNDYCWMREELVIQWTQMYNVFCATFFFYR